MVIWFHDSDIQNFQLKAEEEEKAEQFWKSNVYVAGGYDKRGDFEKLNEEILNLEKNRTVANRLFYLALPPSVFEPVTLHLKVGFRVKYFKNYIIDLPGLYSAACTPKAILFICGAKKYVFIPFNLCSYDTFDFMLNFWSPLFLGTLPVLLYG